MLPNLSPTSRVWIYQSDRALTPEEQRDIQQHLDQFTTQWVSHNQALKAAAEIRHARFIILMVDESQAGASGCSIDSSVRFVQALQQRFKLDLFDRMRFAYIDGDEVISLPRDEFSAAYANGTINDETLVVDTLVKNKAELDDWLKPLGNSWHSNMV